MTRHPPAARTAVGTAALLFGTTGVAGQLLAPGLAPATTAGWRVLIGGGALVLVSVVTGQAPWRYSLRRPAIVIGGLAFLGFQLGFFVAVGGLGVAAATIVSIGTGRRGNAGSAAARYPAAPTATLLYLGLVATAVAYLFWSTGLATLSLGDTVTLTMLEPVAATVLAVAVLHEAAGVGTAIGIAAALAGVWIATVPDRANSSELSRPVRRPTADSPRPASR